MKNILGWIPTTFMVLFFILIAFISYSEWWNIAIGNEADKYAWGETNENSWIYHTPKLYSNVMLVEGLVMSLFITLGLKDLYNRKAKFSRWFYLCFAWIILMVISSYISYP